MKITIKQKNKLTPVDRAYIGLSAIEALLAQYQAKKSFLTLASILAEMEIVFNNFRAIDEAQKQEFGITHEFQDARNKIAHSKSIMALLRENKEEVKNYYSTHLAPIKNQMESLVNKSIFTITPTTKDNLPNSNFEALMRNVFNEVTTMIPAAANHFRQTATEVVLARYFLEQSKSAFEAMAFARIAIYSIKEQYGKAIGDQEVLDQIFKDQDPFYHMLHIRNNLAHEVSPDLTDANLTKFFENLLHGVGINEGKYHTLKKQIETNNFAKMEKKGKKETTQEVKIDTSNQFSPLEIEEGIKDQSSEGAIVYSNNQDSSTQTTEEQQNSKEVFAEAADYNIKKSKEITEQQAKLNAAFNTKKMFEISQKLAALFVGVAALYEKAHMPDFGCIRVSKAQKIPSITIKHQLIEKTLEIATELKYQQFNPFIALLTKAKDVCIEISFQHEAKRKALQHISLPSKEKNAATITAMEELAADPKTLELQQLLSKLASQCSTIVEHDLFDPNLSITHESVSIQDPKTNITTLQILDFNEKTMKEKFSLYDMAYLAPFEPKFLEKVISKGTPKNLAHIAQNLILHHNAESEHMKQFCRICLKENIDLQSLLNDRIMDITLKVTGGNGRQEDYPIHITPLEFLEDNIWHAIALLLPYLDRQNRIEYYNKISSNLEFRDILLQYGAHNQDHSPDMIKMTVMCNKTPLHSNCLHDIFPRLRANDIEQGVRDFLGEVKGARGSEELGD